MTQKALKLRNYLRTEPMETAICTEWTFSPVANMKSYDLTFGFRNWTVDFDGICMHSLLRKNNFLANICNENGRNGLEGFLGRTRLRLVQGITIKPPIESCIAPFMVYATNTYGVNRSTTTANKSSRWYVSLSPCSRDTPRQS